MRCLHWAMRTHHARWNERHMQAMYSLQRTNLQSARAWRMKVALAQVYEAAAQSHSEAVARTGLERWIAWAIRSRLEPFKRLARTLKNHFEGVIAGVPQGRSNAFVEAMNGLMQNAKLGIGRNGKDWDLQVDGPAPDSISEVGEWIDNRMDWRM